MEWLTAPGWSEMFRVQTPLAEIAVRGTLMYLGILLLLRLLRREAGMLSVPDLLLMVLLADAAQNGMAGHYDSITEGLLLIAVIVLWSLALDRLAYRFPRFEHLLHPAPILLIRDGRLQRKNLAREWISREELWGHLREQGIEDLAQVKAAYFEGDGRITVIRVRSGDDGPGRGSKRPLF